MSMSLSPVSTAYATTSLNPTLEEILAQQAKAAAKVTPQDVGSVDPAKAPISSDRAIGGNLDISL